MINITRKLINVGKPSQDVPLEERDAKWHLDYCKWILSQHYGSTLYNRQSLFAEMTDYAFGKQDINKYKNIFGINKSKNKINRSDIDDDNYNTNIDIAKMGYGNINFDNLLSPMPKIIDKIIGLLDAQEHTVEVQAIDENSLRQKRDLVLTTKIMIEEKENIQNINQMAGVEVIEVPEILPENDEELEAFEKLGGFEMLYEKGIKKIIDWTLRYADETEIRRNVLFDLVVKGCSCVIDKVNAARGIVEVEHIDPDNIIIEESPGENKYNKSYCGYIKLFTITELRAISSKDGEPLFTENELYELATKYHTRFDLGNTIIDNIDKPDTFFTNSNCNYNGVKIPVGYFEWKTTTFDYGEEYIYKHRVRQDLVKQKEIVSGKIKEDEEGYYKEIKKKDKQGQFITNHCAYWVLDTDKIFDYGQKYVNTFDLTSRDSTLSMHVYFIKGKSLVERAIPILDTNFAMAYYRFQNDVATSSPTNSYILELSSLEAAKDKYFPNQSGIKIKDIIKLGEATGRWIYSVEMPTIAGGGTQIKYNKPIEPFPGGIGKAVEQFEYTLESGYNQLSNILGVDRISSLSKTPSTELPVGVANIMANNTLDALKPVLFGWISIKDNLVNNIAIRGQLLVRASKDSDVEDCTNYRNILTENEFLSLQEAGDVFPAYYNVFIRNAISEQMKAELLKTAQMATQAGRNGTPALTYSEYLVVADKIQRGASVKEIEIYLTLKENRKKAYEEKIMQQNQQLNNQMAVQVEEMKREKEKELEILKAELEIKKNFEIERSKAFFEMLVIEKKTSEEIKTTQQNQSQQQDASQQTQQDTQQEQGQDQDILKMLQNNTEQNTEENQ